MRLYGTIGSRVDGDYFAHELASLDRDDFDQIHIRMNSPGGNVFQGMSIVSAILSMNTPVCVHIDGIAASMAAVVAVAEIADLKTAKEKADAEIERFKKEREDTVAAEAASFADELIKTGKIAADAKDAVIETYKANPENARKIFGSVPARTKLSSLVGTQGSDASKYAAMSWDELDRAGVLAEIKTNHPDLYEKKYKEMSASLHISRG